MMRLNFRHLLISAVLAFANTAAAQDCNKSAAPAGYTKLVFCDEFDVLDRTRWQVGSGAKQDQGAFFSEDAVEVSRGTLKLKVATRGGKHLIGWLQTKTDNTFGYIEARIRFNSGPGTWGAFWLQSRENNLQPPRTGEIDDKRSLAEADFVKKWGAEIDIVEALNFHQSTQDKVWVNSCNTPESGRLDKSITNYRDILVFNLHWHDVGKKGGCGFKQPLSNLKKGSIQNEWHVYGLEWTESHYSLFLDGILVNQTTRGVSRHPEYVLLTTQVARDGESDFAGKPPSSYGNDWTTRTEVDWIRWWQKP